MEQGDVPTGSRRITTCDFLGLMLNKDHLSPVMLQKLFWNFLDLNVFKDLLTLRGLDENEVNVIFSIHRNISEKQSKEKILEEMKSVVAMIEALNG